MAKGNIVMFRCIRITNWLILPGTRLILDGDVIDTRGSGAGVVFLWFLSELWLVYFSGLGCHVVYIGGFAISSHCHSQQRESVADRSGGISRDRKTKKKKKGENKRVEWVEYMMG